VLLSLTLAWLVGLRSPVELAAAALLAPLPDLDVFILHRELLHNLLFAFGFPLALSYAIPIPLPAALVALLSHLLLDSLTPSGVAPLFPLSRRRWSLGVMRSGFQALAFALLLAAALLLSSLLGAR
jgi:inner membrane protein